MGDTLPMSRATVVVRPGWNEAAHIDAEILHAVAYYEFKTHVEPCFPGHPVVVVSVPD